MKLSDTIELMNSENYEDRFRGEYYQLYTRSEGLYDMLRKYRSGRLSFTPKCSYDLLTKQYKAMELYMNCLVERAEIEGIDLCEIEETKEEIDFWKRKIDNDGKFFQQFKKELENKWINKKV